MSRDTDALIVVGIGASAGGLNALKSALPTLPVGQGFTYVLVQHMDPSHPSTLDQILARYSPLDIAMAEDGTQLAPDHLYISPSDHDCTVVDGAIRFETVDQIGPRHSVDVLFRSIANEYGRAGIGIILSGTGTDGRQGAHDLKAADGLVLVQEPADAEYPGMPAAVLQARLADVVAPAAELGAELSHLRIWTATAGEAPPKELRPDSFDSLLRLMRRKTGFAFDQYKETTLQRRIERRMIVNQLDKLEDYIRLVEDSDTEADVFLKEIQISVTGFFRDESVFEVLAETIRSIVSKKAPDSAIRIWVPGCATGEEAFSIAILVAESLSDRLTSTKVQIFATDIDTDAIGQGRRSVYLKGLANKVPANLRRKYFEALDGTVKVRAQIRDMVVFAEHDLMRDPPFSRLDLISCRNVLIYFRRSAQERLLSSFHYSLNAGGYLLLGPSEGIGAQSELFSVSDAGANLFRRNDVASFPPLVVNQLLRRGSQAVATMAVDTQSPDARTRNTLFERYVPPSVLVSERFDVIYVHGPLDRFVSLPQGEANLNLIDMVASPLRLELRLILQKSQREKSLVRSSPIELSNSNGDLLVEMVAVPADSGDDSSADTVVLFESTPSPATISANGDLTEVADLRIRELDQELTATREHLQTMIEDLEAANEELQSTNEELQSTTEELQSSNEEFQTTNEELQSTNEELHTINDELNAKSEELELANSDLEGILNTVTSALIVLDGDTRVTRYSAGAKDIADLLPTSIGRPVATIGGAIDLTVLSTEIKEAMKSRQRVERELELGDRIFLVRLQPALDANSDGLIISFNEETQLLAAAREQRRLATVISDSSNAITVQDPDGNILEWNRAAEDLYGYTETEALAMNIREIVPRAHWHQLQSIMQRLLSGRPVEPIETRRRRKDQEEIEVSITATALLDEEGVPYAIATTERDLTDQRIAESATDKLLDTEERIAKQRFAGLTAREREVMAFLVEGSANASSRQIASQLGISPRTVDTHRSRIKEKMRARSQTDLVRLAHLCGVLEPDHP